MSKKKSLDWTFDDKVFTSEMIEDYFGFVYLITNTITGKKYIGRKYFYSTLKKKKKGRKNRVILRKQSNWQEYFGSSQNLTNDINEHGKENFKREILSLHESRADVNYYEIKKQMELNVLECDDYYNDNIMNRYYRRKNKTKSVFSKTWDERQK